MTENGWGGKRYEKITEEDRLHVSILWHLNLWTTTAIAEAYKVSRKTVSNCVARYPF